MRTVYDVLIVLIAALPLALMTAPTDTDLAEEQFIYNDVYNDVYYDVFSEEAIAGSGFFGQIQTAMFGIGQGSSGFYGCTAGYCAVAAGVSIAMGPAGVPAFVGGCTSAAVICAFRHF